MKRLAKLIGMVAAVGAIVWLMRDRLVTLTVAREPEPPRFRVPEPASAGLDDLSQIKGIGPTYAQRLSAAGISTIARLKSTSASRLAEIAEVSEARAQGWIDQA